MNTEQLDTTTYDMSITKYRRKARRVEIASSSLQLTLFPHRRDNKDQYYYRLLDSEYMSV